MELSNIIPWIHILLIWVAFYYSWKKSALSCVTAIFKMFWLLVLAFTLWYIMQGWWDYIFIVFMLIWIAKLSNNQR